jgi:hypothetical protein
MVDVADSVRTEYGLLLPNGTVAWNEYRGHSVETPEQRWRLLQVLRMTAEEVGFDEDEFLSCYGWKARTVTTTITDSQSWSIDSNEVCVPPTESSESVDGTTTTD